MRHCCCYIIFQGINKARHTSNPASSPRSAINTKHGNTKRARVTSWLDHFRHTNHKKQTNKKPSTIPNCACSWYKVQLGCWFHNQAPFIYLRSAFFFYHIWLLIGCQGAITLLVPKSRAIYLPMLGLFFLIRFDYYHNRRSPPLCRRKTPPSTPPLQG